MFCLHREYDQDYPMWATVKSALVMPSLPPLLMLEMTHITLPSASLQAPLTLTLCFPGPDLEHLLQRALPDPAHGHLLHLHGLDLQ